MQTPLLTADDVSEMIFSLWVMSIIAGVFVGARHEAKVGGALLGLFLGPLGVFAAAFIDLRPQCKACGTGLNRGFPKCPACGAEHDWKADKGMTRAEALAEIQRKH